MDVDIDDIRARLRSPDERTRARAVREACPCHGSFDALRALTPMVRELARTDPSPIVRREAKHVLRDPIVVNLHEDERYDIDERAERRAERAERRRRRNA